MSDRWEGLAAKYLKALARRDMRAWRKVMSDVGVGEENTDEQKRAACLEN
jgi:formiminotetrahydrofolate cyclodeaminase